MQKITFTKTSILCSFFDQSSLKWIDRDIVDSQLPLSWYLPYTVRIEEGVTIRQILSLLERFTEQIDFMFVNYLKTVPYSELTAALTKAETGGETDKVDSVCLLWAGQVKEIQDSENFLITQPVLMAFEMIDEEHVEDDELYSVHELSVKQLLDTQFVLDELLEYYDEADPTDDEPFGGLVDWTLFQFLSGLLSELTIYAYVNGFFPGIENIELAPLTVSQLFEHLDELDQYYSDQNSKG